MVTQQLVLFSVANREDNFPFFRLTRLSFNTNSKAQKKQEWDNPLGCGRLFSCRLRETGTATCQQFETMMSSISKLTDMARSDVHNSGRSFSPCLLPAGTTSHLIRLSKNDSQTIGYSHSTRLPKDGRQVAGYLSCLSPSGGE